MMVSRLNELKVPELWRRTWWNSGHEGQTEAERDDGIQPGNCCRDYKHGQEHKFMHSTWHQRRRITCALLSGQLRRPVAKLVHDTQIDIGCPWRRRVRLALGRTIDETRDRI
ncbi:MAG: hypothetical protein AVDCRST_MAG93-1255 [uncultured Chloroflexia bacterium]|uniref:Uncharacterized protein n=1 Tax=uncultured Chloroflexia bacterium TaxID=1672391 RepID=A0A6J4I3R9_9CHLR|nr:MAG: hypothetical protein AVDCRST_MAG93-1255 [uncultured Chloroflexia bacterium]